jgi:hypothetical protein
MLRFRPTAEVLDARTLPSAMFASYALPVKAEPVSIETEAITRDAPMLHIELENVLISSYGVK